MKGFHSIPPSTFKLVLFATFLIVQILFPWRYLLYPGNLFWTEDGYRFSWRVMLVEKAGHIDFYVHGKQGKQQVVLSEWLNAQQIKQMSFQPDMILEFAHHLAEKFAQHGSKPKITAECYVTMNGQPGRLFFDKDKNLSEIPKFTDGNSWLYNVEVKPK